MASAEWAKSHEPEGSRLRAQSDVQPKLNISLGSSQGAIINVWNGRGSRQSLGDVSWVANKGKAAPQAAVAEV